MKGNWTSLIVVLIIIAIILILTFSGCASIGREIEAVEEPEPIVYPAIWERLDRRSRMRSYKLTLEGHEYIVVSSSSYGEAGVTMIHSASCSAEH